MNSDAIKSHTKNLHVKAVMACLVLGVASQGRNQGSENDRQFLGG
jgi:hypothetical protein